MQKSQEGIILLFDVRVSEVLTAVLLKIQVFRYVTPCRLLNIYLCFAGLYYLHLQCQTF